MTTPNPSASPTFLSRSRIGQIGERYGLIGIWVLLILFFSLLLGPIFLSWANWQSILGSQAVLVILAVEHARADDRRRLRPLDRRGPRDLGHDARGAERAAGLADLAGRDRGPGGERARAAC